jgi:predicted acyltransferase
MAESASGFRLASVDVFRGATMAAMVIVNTPGDWDHVYAPLLHAEWNGWTPTDLIFPFFVFIVGVSVVLSRRSLGSFWLIVRRAALLYGLGLLLALYPTFNFSTVRIMGVLPRLAVCYLAAALVFHALAAQNEAHRLRTVLVSAALLLVGYWALLRLVPPPGGTAGDLTPSGNLGAWLDRTILGEAHLWRQSKTWDPEGLLSTLPAIGTALSGVAAGIVLRGSRTAERKILILAAAGLVATAAGLIWGQRFPINKNLWTSSYVLFTSGLASIALAACYWLIDCRQWRWVFRPFIVLGMNALVLFVVSGWLVKTLLLIKVEGSAGTRTSLYNWIYSQAFAPFAAPQNASLLFACAALLLLYALLEWLYRRRWFLRV